MPKLASTIRNKKHIVWVVTVKAIVHKAEEGGYWAEVPAMPGCTTQGESFEETCANLREAIEGWLSIDTPDLLNPTDRIVELSV